MSSYSSNIPAHLKTNLQALTAPQINYVHLQKIRSAILCFLTVCATRVDETVYCFIEQFPTPVQREDLTLGQVIVHSVVIPV